MSINQHQFRAMASTFSVRIDIWPESETPQIHQAVQSLMAELEFDTYRMERTMSRFDANSELMHLMQFMGQPVKVSSHLFDVLTLAQQLMQLTNGAFDPRVISYLEKIGYEGAFRTHASIDSPIDKEMLSFVDMMDERTIILKAPIDLGGIGKGHTADMLSRKIEQTLDASVLAGYIVDAGGDIVLAGCQESREPWSVGIENPLTPDTLSAVLSPIQFQLSRMAVCTSSLRRKSWLYHGRSVHHLIDPQTTDPVDTPLLSVTAMGEKAAITEVVTKYVFLRGFESAELWQHCLPRCLWILRTGQLGMTDDIRPFITWLGVNE